MVGASPPQVAELPAVSRAHVRDLPVVTARPAGSHHGRRVCSRWSVSALTCCCSSKQDVYAHDLIVTAL